MFSKNSKTIKSEQEALFKSSLVRTHRALGKEAPAGDILKENVFLEISQNSQENTCARVSFLLKLLAEACSFIKKETLA